MIKIKAIVENIIKNINNFFRLRKIGDTTIIDRANFLSLKKEIDGTTTKNTKNIFRLKKENKAIKHRII